MKKFYNSKELISYISFFMVFFSIVFLLTNCSKSQNEGASSSEGVLRFKVEGVKSENTAPNLKASIGNNNMVGLKVGEHLKEESLSTDDVGIKIISDQENIGGFDDQSNSKGEKIAAPVAMAAGVRYRILVYTLTGSLVASSEAVVGGAEVRISVTPGQKYKWYAYSFNSSESIPAPDSNNPQVTTSTDAPFLYAYDDETDPIVSNGTAIPITFNHQLTQLNVQIGMIESDHFRSVTKLKANFSDNVLQTCVFNILSGSKSGFVSVNNVPMTFTQLTTGSNKTKVAKYYTANETYTNYSVKVTELEIQNTSTTTLDLTSSLASKNQGVVTFGNFTQPNKGNVLVGQLEIATIIPEIKILAYSNGSYNGGYRLGAGTRSNLFLTDARNFGRNSNYVKTVGITIDSRDNGLGLVATALSNPANYPDILYLACDGDYLNAADWAAVKTYLQAGGAVYHGQDNVAPVAATFINDIFGTTGGTLPRPAASYTVYKLTDTPEGAADTDVLNGPFGNTSNIYWGQDRVGTVFFTGYSSTFLDNAIIYSIYPQNVSPITPTTTSRACYFRHRTLNYFFVGDGGFTLYYTGENYGQFAFRTNTDNFPIIEGYGAAPVIGSLAYGTFSGNGAFPMSNSIVFGNLINQLINKIHYNGINRI